jgi:hypothetical protein
MIVALVLTLLITSCGTTKLSSDDFSGVNSGVKAVIRTYNQPIVAGMIFGDEPVTKIISVDGKKIESRIFKLDEQLAVDVGLHEIEFSCSNRAGDDKSDFTEIIKLNFRPYHEYLVRCSFDSTLGTNGSYGSRFSIKEERSK